MNKFIFAVLENIIYFLYRIIVLVAASFVCAFNWKFLQEHYKNLPNMGTTDWLPIISMIAVVTFCIKEFISTDKKENNYEKTGINTED